MTQGGPPSTPRGGFCSGPPSDVPAWLDEEWERAAVIADRIGAEYEPSLDTADEGLRMALFGYAWSLSAIERFRLIPEPWARQLQAIHEKGIDEIAECFRTLAELGGFRRKGVGHA